MKKFLTAVFLLSVIAVNAQTERVLSLKYDAMLYFKNGKKARNFETKNLVVENGNVLIQCDTLSLPFIDDFTKNSLRKNDFYPNNLTDSIFNTYGDCDSALGIRTIQQRFILQPTYTYFFDVANQRVDSTANPAIQLTFVPSTNSNCLYAPSGTLTVYPEFYHYTFDSSNGNILTSILDTVYPDTIISYAPVIYYAQMDADAKWMNNLAHWNTTYPILPPTIGVATLDGLNQYGLPYDNSSSVAYGPADTLTSKPIDLSMYTADDSVFLSFYYQPQGLGDWPNRNDSLTVEFFNNYTSQWDKVWSVAGDSIAPTSVAGFKQVLIPIPATVIPTNNYFYKGFQFQFRNYASLAGNNDHWHIDYVRLSANRTSSDTVISDVAFMYDIPSVLKNYEIMPGKQYTGVSDLADTLKLWVQNDNYDQATTNPPATQYSVESALLYPNPSIVFTNSNVFNAQQINSIVFTPQNSFSFPVQTGDSIALHTTAILDVSNINTLNDTIQRTQIFSNILAYDDGSAERAYGLEGLYLKKFAYEFNLNVPDTLIGFQIHYSNIDVDVEDLVHVFSVWKNITVGAYDDTAIWQGYNVRPAYIDTVNGFAAYALDTPLLLDDKFYIGWQQTDERNLQVGYDLNSTKGHDHMYYYANGVWNKSSTPIIGSVMLRCIFNHYHGPFIGAIDDKNEVQELSIYPNPATDNVFIQHEEDLTVSVFDVNGRLIQTNQVNTNTALNTSSLQSGLYILKFSDQKNTLFSAKKLIISR